MEQINKQLEDLRNQITEIKKQVNEPKADLIPSATLLKWLEISRQTMHRWKDSGILKGYFLGGKLFFKRSEVLEALKIENQINS